MDATARRELTRKEEDGIETVQNKIIHFAFDEDINDLMNSIFEDNEYAANCGVYHFYDDVIYLIEVDKAIDELQTKIWNDTNDCEDEIKVRDYLEPYKNYTIWLS